MKMKKVCVFMKIIRKNKNIFWRRPSADYSHPHYDKCGNFLRRLAIALSSTFLFAKRLPLTSNASLRVETLTWPGTLVLLVWAEI
jgi:hypothetical protein